MVYCKWSRAEAGHCSLKTYYELCELWQAVPPAEIQLSHIAQALGIKQGSPAKLSNESAQAGVQPSAQTNDEKAVGIAQAQAAGLHLFEGELAPHIKDLLADLPLT